MDYDKHSCDGLISSSFIKILYGLQKIKPVKFLSKKHIYPSNFGKMIARRAVVVFSPQVTAVIKYLDQQNSEATVKFMEVMYTFFKIHDVSDRTQYIKQLDVKTAPYMNFNDERLKWMSEGLPEYIDSIQNLSKKGTS